VRSDLEAVVLAGGFATRLYPLTRDKAKPLLPIGGKPAIFHVLDRILPLQAMGLKRIVVVSNHRFAKDFERVLSKAYPWLVEVADNGVEDERGKLGAVGDMAFGARLVSPGTPFLVLAGDNLFDFDLAPAVLRFDNVGGQAVVLLRTLPRPVDTVLYNNVRTDKSGRIVTFVEKPARPFGRRFALCVYVFPPEVRGALDKFIEEGNDPDKAGNFVRWLSGRGLVYALEMGGTWFDIGSFDEIAAADRFWSNGEQRNG